MRTPVVLAAAILLAAGFGACDDDGDSDEAPPAATLTAVSTPAAPAEIQVTEADDGAAVELGLGGTLVVALASNPSTGFSWAVTPPEPTGLELQGEPEFVPPGSGETPVVGAAGTQVFRLEAVRAGPSELTLTYARSFEPGAAGERTFTVTVNVR
jgi:inhibitor of cysteine peptidase